MNALLILISIIILAFVFKAIRAVIPKKKMAKKTNLIIEEKEGIIDLKMSGSTKDLINIISELMLEHEGFATVIIRSSELHTYKKFYNDKS
jgi:hypothetical protein